MMLDVPGASLYYERRGEGLPLLLIPGANGDAQLFAPLAERLAPHRTVITYDRRGFTRSWLDGPQDYERRLHVDADDARQLIHEAGDEPATVCGTSSGAVVALQLLLDHPDSVSTVVAHEPAAFRLLPDAEDWRRWFDHVYDVYRASGPAPAQEAHRERAFPESDRQAMGRTPDPERMPQANANATYWLEREMRQYTAAPLDLGEVRAHSDRVVPAAGNLSTGYPTAEIAARLADELGTELLDLPGGHIGYATHADEFAEALRHARV